MRQDKTYPRFRGRKPKGISRKLKAIMRYNTIENNKRISFFTRVETKDTYLVQNILKLKEVNII